MRRLIVVVALFALGCGGGSSPTAPEPTPTANITARGTMTFSCGIDCTFEGEAFNAGPGCATNVRGVSRLFTEADVELGRAEWSLPGRTIRPSEAFLYGSCCFTRTATTDSAHYRTSFTRDPIRC